MGRVVDLVAQLTQLHKRGMAAVDLSAGRLWIGRDGMTVLLDWSRSELLNSDVSRVAWRSPTSAPETESGRSVDVSASTDGYALSFLIPSSPSSARREAAIASLRSPDPVNRPASLRDVLPEVQSGRSRARATSYTSPRLQVVADKGPIRPTQQDRWSSRGLRSSTGFVCVADGMGGGAFGALAAELAIEALHLAWRRLPVCLDDPDGSKLLRGAAAAAVELANEDIGDFRRRYGVKEVVGTTLSAILWRGDDAVLLHVGDSRCYRLTAEAAVQVSEDHAINGALTCAIDGTCGRGQISSLDRFRDFGWCLCSDGFWSRVQDSSLPPLVPGAEGLASLLLQMREQERESLDLLSSADNATALFLPPSPPITIRRPIP